MIDFWTVFSATLLSQISVWLIDRYIKTRMNDAADKIEHKINKVLQKRRSQMGRLAIDIEQASNEGYVVTWYKHTPNAMQKLTGVKEEKEQLAFTDIKKLAAWISIKSKNV